MKKKNSQLKESKKGVINKSVNDFSNKFVSGIYSSDVRLFAKLGLKKYSKIPTHEKYFVGEVKLDNCSSVKIWVCPMPALFWTFEIFNAERKETMIISTGSGSLSDFWNTIKLFADNMLEISYK